MRGGADSELIELLDADPSVFGRSTVTTPARAPRPRRRPNWTVPAAAAVIAIVALAATLVIWKPWVNEFAIRLALPSATPVEPTLTERLVFDVPPAELSGASLGLATSDLLTFGGLGGYIFAASDASLRLGQGGIGTWATFYAASADDASGADLGSSAINITVQGAPGVLNPALGDRSLRVTFGPLDDRIYTVVSSELPQTETLAFAEVVGIEDGAPVVEDISVLAGMQPLCSIDDFNAAYSLILMASNPDYSQPRIVTAQYGAEAKRFTLTSQWAPESGLVPLQFVLGGTIDAQVRGEPALAFELDASESLLVFGIDIGSVVAWVEGGRLVMVTGQLPVEELLVLAESVRPATDAEWTAVSDVAAVTAVTIAD